LFTSVVDIAIGRQQLQIISGWASLITILAEHIDTSQGSITVPENERLHLKNYLTPSDNWSIFAASLDSKIWNARYRHHSLMLADFANISEYYAAFGQNRPSNTQISSFGIGKIFVQVFSCPNQRFTTHFRIWAEASGLAQLWPIPSGVWPSAKFPTTLVLKDEAAEELSNAYNDRIKIMTQPPLLGGLDVAGAIAEPHPLVRQAQLAEIKALAEMLDKDEMGLREMFDMPAILAKNIDLQTIRIGFVQSGKFTEFKYNNYAEGDGSFIMLAVEDKYRATRNRGVC
jgi:hypothetical protein